MHILFVEPSFPANQRQFVRALAGVGGRVTGIGERPVDYLDSELRSWLHGYEQVGSVCHEQEMLDTVRRVQGREWVDLLEATVEAHILPVARVREAAAIPGTTIQTAFLCRDKPAMKAFLRENGVPCALSGGISSAEEAREFARRVGFPIILKPRAGAGAADTQQIDDAEELEQAIVAHGIDQGHSVAAEEFVEGHEAFYDTLTVGGEVAHEFISHYYPGVLEGMRERWISPYLVTTNRLDAPDYEEVRELGHKVIRELGIGTSATHMEWFFGPKGLKFSEIGCRPPGVGTWDLYSAANEMDLFREWAAALVHGRTEATATRRYSAGLISLRPDRDGRVEGYEGIDDLQRRYGQWVIDSHFPAAGTPTQPIEGGYMANAWVQMRHPDYDELCRMLEEVGRTVQLRAG